MPAFFFLSTFCVAVGLRSLVSRKGGMRFSGYTVFLPASSSPSVAVVIKGSVVVVIVFVVVITCWEIVVVDVMFKMNNDKWCEVKPENLVVYICAKRKQGKKSMTSKHINLILQKTCRELSNFLDPRASEREIKVERHKYTRDC